MAKVLRRLTTAAVLAWGGAAAAQPVPEYEPLIEPLGQMVSGCLGQSYDAESALSCHDLSVQACLAMGPDGDTTFGMTMCAIVLEDLWDAELNRLWPEVQADVGPENADYLLEEQRAWLAYRDAACAYTVAEVWGGTMAQHVGGDCRVRMTAERVAQFRDMLR
jgi:uncharacterized protein YecT (DUF1311 family)